MSTSPAPSDHRLPPVDAGVMRRLFLHEARVHAMPGRTLRDLDDSILLHDPVDPEPFWNRIEAIHWPADPDAFDRRLAEVLILFTSLLRQPHVWPAPAFDEPADLVARLLANGFRDMGAGCLMALADPTVARGVADRQNGRNVRLERVSGVSGRDARAALTAIAPILVDAFDVEADREAGVRAETAASLANPVFTHYLVRVDGEPAAVARRATFDGASYLSSIGTASWARGRGLGELVTLAATDDAETAGSEWIYLGVFAENQTAIRLYERAGYLMIGEPAPDLLLVG